MATIISFTNHKGGTGKTTSVVNIACALRDKKYNVLLIDLDPQGNLSYSLGVNDYTYNVLDWLIDGVNLDSVVVMYSGLSIIPSSVNIINRKEEFKEKNYAKNLLQHNLKKTNYDFILIDCPPAIGTFTKLALSASDFVIIPMLLEILSIQGLTQIIKFIEEIKADSNPNIEILGVLGVCVNESRKLTNEVLEFIDLTYNVDVFNNRIHNNVKAAEAPSFAKSVIDYAPSSTSAKEYIAVTQELLKKISYSKKIK